MVKQKYKVGGYIPSNIDADKIQEYAECLEEITENNGGELTPHLVVKEAKDKNSPLHEVFEWDNSIAGERFRVQQARELISCVIVEVKFDHTSRDQKAFFSVKNTNENRESSRVYVTLNRVLTEPDLRKNVIADALREVEGWRIRYNQYVELGNIFKVIESTKRKVSKKMKIKI